jgi:predicted alpha/beta superfamily hydrolase
VKTRQVFIFSDARPPDLEFREFSGQPASCSFTRSGSGRRAGESCWVAEPDLPAGTRSWQFRLKVAGGPDNASAGRDYYTTRLQTLWLQAGQIFDYPPAVKLSPSQVIKIPQFKGRLSPRPLYIYLPRGYAEHTARKYPVLYMHDGQNCFEAFSGDSFAGSWRAEQTADRLIGQGLMRECIIVGVSHGGPKRIVEYLPPYSTYTPTPGKPVHRSPGKTRSKGRRPEPVRGRADFTLAYYQHDVAAYLQREYRVLAGREETATCGSSMGGLFSAYIAWEHPEFARHHAIMSPSFWMTRTRGGRVEAIERLRTLTPPDVRLWLDSGTLDAPGRGDDGAAETLAARRALLENGFRDDAGPNLKYYRDEGAVHSEAAWAARLHLVFEFLFPLG